MSSNLRLLPLLALCVAAGAAHAESLRCNGQIAAVGESKLSVLRKCGEPVMRDSYCKPIETLVPLVPYPGAPYVAGTPVIRSGPACEIVDEWAYDRGEGNLFATVRFKRGAVDAILYEARR